MVFKNQSLSLASSHFHEGETASSSRWTDLGNMCMDNNLCVCVCMCVYIYIYIKVGLPRLGLAGGRDLGFGFL